MPGTSSVGIQSWPGTFPASSPLPGLMFAQVSRIPAVFVLAGSKESEKRRVETGAESPSPAGEGSWEPRGKEGTGADGHSDLRNIDSAEEEEESTDTEETVRGGPDPAPGSVLS